MATRSTAFIKDYYRAGFGFLLVAAVLLLSISESFLLFHTVIELFAIVVGVAIFTVTWNSRKILDNNYLYFVGIAYLFIAALDLMHTITAQGMNIIMSPGYYANQFWVATRMLEALTFIAGFYFLARKSKLNADLIFVLYLIITSLIIASILYWHNFPVCYIKGLGQTTFKIYSEYLIICLSVYAGYLLFRKKQQFTPELFRLLVLMLVFFILSESCFAVYTYNDGTLNAVGHVFKLASYYCIYKADVETGFTQPTNLLFKNLNESEEQLKKLNATKDKFFSIIAHDLKNPFTSLIVFSELLYKNAGKLEAQKITNIAHRMNDSAKSAFNLLENLLNWSRAQTGDLQAFARNYPLKALLESMQSSFAAVTYAKGIDLEFDYPEEAEIHADLQMTETILRNLISNAIKFSHAEGKIIVSAYRRQEDIQFAVRDFGVGMTAEQVNLGKDESRHTTTTGTANEKGTGIGLMICRDFVQLNQGKIWVESEVGKGTTFFFTLPAGR